MTVRTSRTYKLKLSDEGIDAFLACHCRLAHLVREFLPYGATLQAAVALIEPMEACELAAELADPLCDTLAGSHIRFVGTSPQLAETVTRLIDRLGNSDELAGPPPVARLYLAALCAFRRADDREVRAAHRRARGKVRLPGKATD